MVALMTDQQNITQETVITPKKKWRKMRIFGWLLIILALLITIDYFTYPLLSPLSGRTGNIGENGIWLRYKWYFGEYTEKNFNNMTEHLRDGQIKYAYCHVRFIKPDGTLQFRYAKTGRKFVTDLRKKMPGVKIYAWIYVGTGIGRPVVNLADADIMQKTVSEARWLVNNCGFDGIQWDYEVCPSGDPAYPELLRQSRRILPKGTLLGACTPMWYPKPIPRKYCWDTEYFTEIAKYCDQIAVMGYDSAIYLPRAYAGHLSKQVTLITNTVAAANQNCKVMIGVPTYDGGEYGPTSHHGHAENLRVAIKGVREGIANKKTKLSAFNGISIFADYTTDEDEWSDYYRYWLETKAEKVKPAL
jgi:hypothetical protein